jgi:hypothetical protein
VSMDWTAGASSTCEQKLGETRVPIHTDISRPAIVRAFGVHVGGCGQGMVGGGCVVSHGQCTGDGVRNGVQSEVGQVRQPDTVITSTATQTLHRIRIGSATQDGDTHGSKPVMINTVSTQLQWMYSVQATTAWHTGACTMLTAAD